MAEKLHLEIVTPERKVFEAEVDRVEVPGLDGELGILPGHTELVSELKPAGLLTYHIGEKSVEIAVSDGLVEVSSNRVVILAKRASRPEDIDIAQAIEMKTIAERQLQSALADPDLDMAIAVAELERATIELQLAERSR